MFGLEWAAIWATFKTVLAYLIATGTNEAVFSLITKNILGLSLLVIITPWKWDNSLLKKIKDAISNFKKKGEGTDDAKTNT